MRSEIETLKCQIIVVDRGRGSLISTDLEELDPNLLASSLTSPQWRVPADGWEKVYAG